MTTTASKLVKQARAKINEKIFTFNKRIKKINVVDIPEEYERFLDTNFFWRRVKTNEGSLPGTCVFHCPEGGIFEEHQHPNQNESIMVLKGCVQCITAQEIRVIKEGQSITIEKGEVHKFIFEKRTVLIVAWYPAFSKWEGSFLDD